MDTRTAHIYINPNGGATYVTTHGCTAIHVYPYPIANLTVTNGNAYAYAPPGSRYANSAADDPANVRGLHVLSVPDGQQPG
jgi:hypothetical protein